MWHKTFHQLLIGTCSTWPWPNGSDERMQPCMGSHYDHTLSIESLSKRMLSPRLTSLEPFTHCVLFFTVTHEPSTHSVLVFTLTHKSWAIHSQSFLQSNTCQLNPSVSGCFLPVIPVLSLFTSRTVVYFWYNGLLLKFPEMCILVWRLLLSALMPVLSRVQLKCANQTMVPVVGEIPILNQSLIGRCFLSNVAELLSFCLQTLNPWPRPNWPSNSML